MKNLHTRYLTILLFFMVIILAAIEAQYIISAIWFTALLMQIVLLHRDRKALKKLQQEGENHAPQL